MPAPASNQRCRVGLAFGGGMPFALVALGVLRAFEEERIRIDRLAGTSLGSILAATYAAGTSPDECLKRFQRAFSTRNMLSVLLRDLSFSPRGILRGREIIRAVDLIVGRGLTFEDLRIPLRIPACDLADGSEVVFESGPVSPAIRASISMPGIFTPFKYEGRRLADGALLRPIPVHLLHADEVDLVIPVRAVREREKHSLQEDLARERQEHKRRLGIGLPDVDDSMFAVMWRGLSLIMQDEFAELLFDDFDVYIKPRLDLELSRDTDRLDEIVAAGHAETMRVMPKIREAMARIEAAG